MSHLILPQRNNRELWLMACYSAVFHVVVGLSLLNFQLSAHFKEAPVYYVDLLTLPVASPQAGMPGASEPAPAPPQPAATPPQEMALPTKPSTQIPAKATVAKAPPQADPTETTREFEERIARMERDTEARHQAAALDALKKRASNSGPVGMPGATGSEAGSDYGSYIRSRLEDAFRREDTFKPSPGKEAIVRLTIDRNGRIISQRYERRSTDQMFNDAVARAIARAEKDFRRPPNGSNFEQVISFKPQGIGKK